MFYGECYKCGERWELGTASTCKCEDVVKWDASAPVLITSHPNFYKRPWVGLTDEEIEAIYEQESSADIVLLTQAKLKEKNT
jgi:hypothetical protein